ncbi:hypothetical protein N3K66_002895 [Trichothecium roseum]|uniref:Uncharacterized protein n=1 Tax=Trichothecium roseum TaxID=47278 RepID=A0ACC0V4E1_9HYPO|nr:hypothetical protein N3K66_002895 [Trichothecium roseum]
MAVSIAALGFEHHRSALGIAETEPRITWRFAGDAQDWEQTSYDLEVTRGSDTKSHTVESPDSLLVEWPEDPLTSTESAQVRARAHGKEGQDSTPWSDWVSVETGLLSGEDWHGAVPIAAQRDTEKGERKRAIYFRKAFSGGGKISKARLYVTSLGIYQAEINGKRVGDHELAPGWQSYNFRHVYDTYDVTDMLDDGDNAIGIFVGEGWFVGRMGFEDGREWWGDTIGVIALLSITTEDGKTTTIVTDDTWKANLGPVMLSDIYDGEIYDSRLEADIIGWNQAGYDDSSWLGTKELPALKGALSSPDGPPIVKQEEITPLSITKSPSGKTIIDFGQNLVGWLRLNEVNGPSGTNITLHHAEVLENGELSLRPLRTAKATDTLILHGEAAQTWEPHFTFHGFRYAQVDGWPEETTPLTPESITAIVIFSDMEETGQFECSHGLLTQFHNNVRWSMRGNFLSLPTDCPQRDERLGWTGDAHAFGPTANFLYDTAGFWRGWHRDVWSEMQRGGRNVVPFFVPTLPPDSEDAPATYWGDVAVGGPYNLFRAFGDAEMLGEQFDQARAWIDQGVPRTAETNLWDRSGSQFGDWLDPEAPPDNAGAATTHPYLVADAYLVEMTRVLGNISATLGHDDLAAEYAQQHDDLRTEFQKAWISSEGELLNQTQTAYALALQFDLYTDEQQRQAAAETLRTIIADNDYLVGTGFAGTPALGPALEGIGAVPDFYAMLLQTRVPSWLYQVVQNATTTWERWDSLLEDGSVNPGSMTSFNHYSFGAISDTIHRVIGGLAPAEPGWKVASVKPQPGGDITSADTKYLSPYGQYEVAWSVEGSTFKLNVRVPPNAKARVTLPGEDKETEFGSGVHQFSKEGFEMPTV